MIRAIGYARVSTRKQADYGHSIEAQRAAIAALCEAHGLDLVEIIEDPAVSGKDPFAHRPGGARAVRLLDDGRAEAIVSVALDRLGRDAADTQRVVRAILDAGVKLYVGDMGGRVTRRDFGDKILLALRAEIAEEERLVRARRTQAAIDVLRTKHHRWSHHPPLTMRFEEAPPVKPGGKPTYIVVSDERMAAAANLARALRDTLVPKIDVRKTSRRRMPYREIGERLVAAGYEPARGGPWADTQVKRLIEQSVGPVMKRRRIHKIPTVGSLLDAPA